MSVFIIFLTASLAFGLAVGSFCGSTAYRIAHEWSLFKPVGSHCPGCGKRLKWYENIPLASYLLQRGRCRGCAAELSILYPLAEASAGLWSVTLFLRYGLSGEYWIFMGIGMILLLISLVDLEAYFIPDELVLLGSVLAGGASLAGIGIKPVDAFAAALLGAFLLQVVRLGYQALRSREGMGFGDVKLMFLLGLCTGLTGLPYVLLLSALLAFGFTALANWRSVSSETKLPFGPYLCAGCALFMLFGETLQQAVQWALGGA